ncbi:MAG: hypothetical protein HN742_04350 [Lentisphaerae bacterium]|jgi:hypothetical protein|nr:hypothetical protein [Lentisphaerota bacterium]MBT4818289.1 hypothetical protein [Lentisphaerota bacterium]MBT5609159.1 hypothetical protein [Lentisphaerota bacterium]MBT7054161.1 hypothetical protein [Lentisphaerota bacterium]MBT7841075.1 hypothetical protein [Lentisphaerota bacterium]
MVRSSNRLWLVGTLSLAWYLGSAALVLAGPGAYPISGYWFFGRSSRAAWRAALTKARATGADTAIQFGPRPKATDLGELRDLAPFALSPELVAKAVQDLAGVAPDAEIRRVFRYGAKEQFGARLLEHSAYERSVRIGDTIIWRLAFPFDSSGRPSELPVARIVDLVFVSGSTKDSVAMLLAEAGALEMQVFVGMPTAPQHPTYPWDPWGTVMPTFLRFANRVLGDYAQRFGASEAFVGVYQSVELPVAARTLRAALNCYRDQHVLVRQKLPGRRIMVSPYWDARKRRPTGVTADSVRRGIIHIARTDVDIIAPQDSRGTGKVGLFWDVEASAPVAAGLHCVTGVGETTYGDAYHANTRRFYQAAREAVDSLTAEGITVDLWANLEGFAPGKGIPCGSFTTSQRTTKERLDRQIMMAGTYPAKLVCYMWDSYFTCQAGHPEPLADTILAGHDQPIVVAAAREDERLVLTGYHLAGGQAEVSDGDQVLIAPPGTGVVKRRDPGESGRYPDGLEWVEWAWPAGAGEACRRIRVRTARGWSQTVILGE